MEEESEDIWEIEDFQKVDTLRFDFYSGSLFQTSIFESPSTRITTLDIRGLAIAIPHMFIFVAVLFPQLRHLSVNTYMMHCSKCSTFDIPAFASPVPKSLVYENVNGYGLPVCTHSVLNGTKADSYAD